MLNRRCRSAPLLLSLPSLVTQARLRLWLLCKFHSVQVKFFVLTMCVGPDREATSLLRHHHVEVYRRFICMCLSGI